MSSNLSKYEVLESDRDKPCWNLGWIEIDQTSARKILGEPHFIETNEYATAGGTEDLWTFKPEDYPIIFIRLRVPYSHMDLYVGAKEIPSDIWNFFSSLFPDRAPNKLDKPFDAMRHPDDGKYYCPPPS